MAKTKISEYSSTSAGADLNTDINSIDIDEGCAPSGINNAIRTLMAQVKDFQTGVKGDTLTVGGTLVASSNVDISGNLSVTGTAGALTATSLSLSGNLTASAISGASLTLSGNMTASAISGASLSLSGNITASAISGASLTLSGDVTASAISCASLSVGGSDVSNTPIFKVSLSADQSIADATGTKVQWNSEQIDTDSAFDSTTNYRFTVPSGKGGKYYFEADISFLTSGFDQMAREILYIYKNGAIAEISYSDFRTGSEGRGAAQTISTILDLSAGDYVEIYVFADDNTNANIPIRGGTYSRFMGYKLIG